MKKTVALLIMTITLLTVFTGCSDGVKITDHDWVMTLAQTEGGEIVAFGKEGEANKEFFGDAVLREVELSAEFGKFTITDATDGKTYEGSYKKKENKETGTVYKIKIGDHDGTAIVSSAENSSEGNLPTLIIAVGGYAMSFKAK